MMTMIEPLLADSLKMWLISLDIHPCHTWEDVECRMDEHPYPKPVRISDGASKICFVFKDYPFVIKWSTEDCGEAMQEVDYYEDAKACRLDKLFPTTEYFFSHNGVDFVVQEKIQFPACDVWGDYSKKYENISKTVPMGMIQKVQRELNKVTGYTRHISPLWIACVLSIYGKKTTKALCKFVQEHDINDLHGNNVGFLRDKPIILDFSGYHREE